MGYITQIEGFEGQDMEAKVSFWAGPKLYINGEPAAKGKKRGEILLQRNDGKQVTATWKPQALGFDVPQLVVDGKVTNVVEPLKWYQLVWGGLPIALVFIGGLIGGVAGAIGFSINAKVFRTEINDFLKYVATGVISAMSVILYFVAAVLFTALING